MFRWRVDRRAARLDHLGPHAVAIAERPAHRTLADRDQPILLALAFTDEERAALGIEIGAIEPDEFHAPNTGRVEDFDDRPVAAPERGREVRLGQHAFDFAHREHGAREAPRELRHLGSAAGFTVIRFDRAAHASSMRRAVSLCDCVAHESAAPSDWRTW